MRPEPAAVRTMGDILGPHPAPGPWVAVSFSDDTTAPELAATAGTGMDVVEFRVDRFTRHDPDHVTAVVGRAAGIPRLATIRAAAEGGGWSGTDDERMTLFGHLMPVVDAVDIELSSTAILDRVARAAHDHGRVVIGSFHDFDGTPTTDALAAIVQHGIDHGVDVVKMATMVRTDRDLGRLARLATDDHGTALIVIGMGARGAPSRLLFPFLGSRLTFAAVGEPSAPGQLPLAAMADTFRLLSPAYAARHPAPVPPDAA